jgi:hypothetical protein
MGIFCLKKILIGCIYLSITNLSYAITIPSELIGTWGPAKTAWNEWGKSWDGRPVRCDANPSTGNQPGMFYGFFPDGELAAGNPMGAQCSLKRLDKITGGYSGVMHCKVEATIKEIRPFIYQRGNPSELSVHSEKLYKCKSTL